jgi:hypothetical protein
VFACHRTGWILYDKVIAVVVMKLLERFDNEKIDRKPDRASPIGVATEKPGTRLPRLVAHLVYRAIQLQPIRMVEVMTADRANTIFAEELISVKHACEQSLHAMAAGHGVGYGVVRHSLRSAKGCNSLNPGVEPSVAAGMGMPEVA